MRGTDGDMGVDEVRIRPLEGMEDWTRAGVFQELIWGPGFPEKAPPSLLMVASRLGGVVAGAFRPDGEMVGFVFGITGLEDGRPVHWSDMLGVAPGARDLGLGTRLKRYQRDRMLERGVTRVYWTYDPLESRNGWLNLHRLGAEAVEYAVDLYGASSSPLHRGLGTDRFVVRWELNSERVRRCMEAEEANPAAAGEPVEEDMGEKKAGNARPTELPSVLAWTESGAGPMPDPSSVWPGDEAGAAARLSRYPEGFRVAVPARIQELKARDPTGAVAWRRATRAVLRPALAAGWRAVDLVPRGPVSEYVVRPPPEIG